MRERFWEEKSGNNTTVDHPSNTIEKKTGTNNQVLVNPLVSMKYTEFATQFATGATLLIFEGVG